LWAVYLLAGLAGLAGLIILALSLPVEATFNLDTADSPKFRLRLNLLFGLFSRELGRGKKKPKEKAAPGKPKKPKKKKKRDFGMMLRILQAKGLFRQIKALIKGILRQFRIRELTVDIKLAPDDPASAGMIYALAGAVPSSLNLPRRYRISITPSFSEETEGYFHSTISLQPIKLAGPVLRFIFSLAAFRVAKAFISSKWKRK
jgi:hypothetical protein